MTLESLKTIFAAGLWVWILAGGSLICLFVDAVCKRASSVVYVFGGATLIGALGAAWYQWIHPHAHEQTVFFTDTMALFFVMLILLVGLLSLLNLYAYKKSHDGERPILQAERSQLSGSLVTLLLFALVGMIFLFTAKNLILVFIGLETLSLAIYVLVGSNRREGSSHEAALKYFVMGSAASAILLYGIALFYGAFKTMTIVPIQDYVSVTGQGKMAALAIAMILAGLFFKLAIAPFHVWAPDVYEGAPVPVTGFMAAGVKVAVFAFLSRLLISSNFISTPVVVGLFTVAVVLTLLVGNFGALVQDNLKRMLAYSSIAHAGYLLLGVVAGYKDGSFVPEAFSRLNFYLLTYSLMTLGAFAVLCVLIRDSREANQYADLTGMGFRQPFLAALLSLFMLSLLGLPPTAGFVAKYGIFSMAVQNGYVGLAVFGIVTSLVSAYYYLRVIVVMYFHPIPQGSPLATTPSIPFPLMFSLVFCGLAIIYLGLNPLDYLKMTILAVQAVP